MSPIPYHPDNYAGRRLPGWKGRTRIMNKKRILVLFGGASSEHEVSVMSAASVIKAMDRTRYHIMAAGITPEGLFQLLDDGEMNRHDWPGFDAPRFTRQPDLPVLLICPGTGAFYVCRQGQTDQLHIDVVFPVLHGPFGEDGRLQGLLDMCGIPYVGAGVLASAVAMDKGITKRLLAQEGIPQTPHIEFRMNRQQPELDQIHQEVENKLGYPVFVKPANLGSSVGISKADQREALHQALILAMKYDEKILVERAVHAREIECAVLGSGNPRVSLPAEVLPSREFYDYEDKYFSGTSQTQAPADLTADQIRQIQETALQVYKLLECQGLARIDFFIDRENGQLLVNEINTMPGFTSISLYPKMWTVSGISYAELIHLLIQDALERKEDTSIVE